MTDSVRNTWHEYWSADPVALHAERRETTRLILDRDGNPTGITLEHTWYDANERWVLPATRFTRIGNPHRITAHASSNPHTGGWTVHSWAVPAHPSDGALTDLASFAAQTEAPHYSGLLVPQQPKKRWDERRDSDFYPERFPAERTLQIIGNAIEIAAIRVAYSLVTETHPNMTLLKMIYNRSMSGTLDGQRFAIRFKGQRASLHLVAPDGVTPLQPVEVRLPAPYPFLEQLDGSPAERIAETVTMLLNARANQA